jgi:hypothetical protein
MNINQHQLSGLKNYSWFRYKFKHFHIAFELDTEQYLVRLAGLCRVFSTICRVFSTNKIIKQLIIHWG